jgi:hypothetical protein
LPNGVDRNYHRVVASCARYRQRYNVWPDEIRLDPSILWDLAHVLDGEQFRQLANRVRLRTRDAPGISVGGGSGVVQYDFSVADIPRDSFEQAWDWLGIEPRDVED